MAIRTANTQSLTEITAFPSAVALGGLILLATETASSSDLVTFDSDIDDTYKEYIFKFINLHPSAANAYSLTFNGSIDTGSNYNVTKTTTVFRAYHDEGDTATAVDYRTGSDIAQGTGFQTLGADGYLDDDADSSFSGTLHLINPSSTTFVKHFIATTNMVVAGPQSSNNFVAGYFNDTNDIDAIQFKMSTGNIDAGTFKLYGVT